MDIRNIGIIAALVLTASGCASSTGTDVAEAKDGQPAQTAMTSGDTAEQSLDAGDETICKTVVKTGTRLRERICATRDAWEQSAAYGRKATEDMQSKPIYKDSQ